MSGPVADLLVDSDVFIDHLRGARQARWGRDRIHYSSITRCELFAGQPSGEPAVRALLDPFTELAVDREVAERAGRLRRRHPIRTPDALIAATAIVHGLTLITRNLRDFDGIGSLRVRAPRDPR